MASVFSDAGLANALLVAGVAMVIFFLISRLRRRGRPSAPTRLSVQESLEKQRQTRALGGDLEQVMVEIQQMSRRVGAQLDAKAARLENLIAEADQRIHRLQKLQESIQAEPSTSKAVKPPATVPGLDVGESCSESSPTVSADPLTRQVYDLADQGLVPEEIARQLGEHIGKVELILALRRG